MGIGLGLLAAASAPLVLWAQEPNEPAEEGLEVVEEQDGPAEGAIDETEVYHLYVGDGRPRLERSPWRTVASPPNTDPGDAAEKRNEPNYEPGVVILTF